MKKILLLSTLMIFGFTHISHGQLQEGNFMLGADIGSGLSTTSTNGLFGINIGLNEESGFNIGISPKVGYFFTDTFVAGAIVNLGYTNSEGSGDESVNTFVYGVQALARFYVAPSDINLGNKIPTGYFFLETHAGIAGVNVEDGPTTNGFAFGFGPGYSLFLNQYVALEASVKYNGLVGGGNTDYQHSLGINLGIQIFQSRAEAENTAEEF